MLKKVTSTSEAIINSLQNSFGFETVRLREEEMEGKMKGIRGVAEFSERQDGNPGGRMKIFVDRRSIEESQSAPRISVQEKVRVRPAYAKSARDKENPK
jgi:hypothetical protein